MGTPRPGRFFMSDPLWRAEMIASIAADLSSPKIVGYIDRLVADLRQLRATAVNLHSEPPPEAPPTNKRLAAGETE